MFVVDAGENFGGDFIGSKKMVEISAGVVFAVFAITVIHQWSEIVSILGVFDVDATVLGVKRAVSGHASWADAVKSIATVFGANKQVDWLLAHAEQMARFVFWQNAIHGF